MLMHIEVDSSKYDNTVVMIDIGLGCWQCIAYKNHI